MTKRLAYLLGGIADGYTLEGSHNGTSEPISMRGCVYEPTGQLRNGAEVYKYNARLSMPVHSPLPVPQAPDDPYDDNVPEGIERKVVKIDIRERNGRWQLLIDGYLTDERLTKPTQDEALEWVATVKGLTQLPYKPKEG